MSFSNRIRVSLSCVCLLYTGAAHAELLGRLGPTYEIKEEDMVEYMQRRAQEAIQSGEIEKRRQAKLKEVQRSYQDPTPVAGLREATMARTFMHDPSVVSEEDILDDKGKLVVPAGTRANPLDYISLSKAILFFDARSSKQAALAARIIEKYQRAVVVILVGGSPTEVRKQWGMKIFFDQRGYLTRKLGIQQVPALVTQAGDQLRVDEIKVD